MSDLNDYWSNSSNFSELTYLMDMGNSNSNYGASTSSGGTSLMTGGGFMKSLGGLMAAFMGNSGGGMINMGEKLLSGGIKTIEQGTNLTAGVYREAGKSAIYGSEFEAKVYRQAGETAVLAANYNVALDQFKTDRGKAALGRELSHTLSSNTAQAAANGLSLSSRSTLAVQNGVISAAERQVLQIDNDAKQRQSMISYQGQLTKVNYENEALAAEYSGKVAQQSYENQAKIAEYQGQVDIYKMRVDAWKEEVTNQRREYELDQQAQSQMMGSVFGLIGGLF